MAYASNVKKSAPYPVDNLSVTFKPSTLCERGKIEVAYAHMQTYQHFGSNKKMLLGFICLCIVFFASSHTISASFFGCGVWNRVAHAENRNNFANCPPIRSPPMVDVDGSFCNLRAVRSIIRQRNLGRHCQLRALLFSIQSVCHADCVYYSM